MIDDPKPVVRCLVAHPEGGGIKYKPLLVSLAQAYEFYKIGWYVLPDLDDLRLLAEWERRQRKAS